MLELNRGGRAGVQTEMVEFIALPFPSSKKNLKKLSSYLCGDGKERDKLFK